MITKKTNKKKYNTVFIISFIINIVLVIALCMSVLFRNASIVINSDIPMFNQAYETLKENWVNTGDDIDLESAAISGLVDSLGDPHTDYYSIEEATEFNTSVSGTYVGIGIGFHMLSKGAMVTVVYSDTPASEVGIIEGDILLESDGVSLAGLTSDEVKVLVTGEEGTVVTLKIQRGTEILTVEVPRKDVDISASYEIVTKDGVMFGYVELTTFGTNTPAEVEEAFQLFKSAGIDTLVIDVRGNGGGYLTAAKGILDLLIDEGDPLYQMQGNSGPAEVTYASGGTKYSFDTGYILIDGSSASASELLTTSLQDMLDYQTVGTTTYGKGTAQTQYQLSDGSTLKYTYAKWLSAKGQFIHEVGIIPDVEVENLDLSDISTASLEEDLEVDCVNIGVQSMQHMLDLLGYEVDRTDGYFSEESKEALELFEADYGLDVNGIYSEDDHQYLIGLTMIYIGQDSNDIQYNTVVSMMK